MGTVSLTLLWQGYCDGRLDSMGTGVGVYRWKY